MSLDEGSSMRTAKFFWAIFLAWIGGLGDLWMRVRISFTVHDRVLQGLMTWYGYSGLYSVYMSVIVIFVMIVLALDAASCILLRL